MTEHETTRGKDRRSAWTDPHFWVPIVSSIIFSFFSALGTCAVMLVAGSRWVERQDQTMAGIGKEVSRIGGQVSTLSTTVNSTHDESLKLRSDVATLQAATTRIDGEKSILESRIIVLEKSYSRLEGRLSK